MGQGTYTSMPMLLAEELEAPLNRCMSSTRRRTTSSTPIPCSVPGDRRIDLGARLLGAAARSRRDGARDAGVGGRANLGRRPATCRAEAGQVVHTPVGASLPTARSPPKPQSCRRRTIRPKGSQGVQADRNVGQASRHAGQGQRQGGVRHRHALPGMKIATVAACPVFGGRLGASTTARPRR